MKQKDIIWKCLMSSAILFMAMTPCSASPEQQSDMKDLKTIRVKFEIKPAKSRIIKEGDKEYLEPQYDPSEDIILGLRNAGFNVQTDNNSNADMILTLTHVENAYATMAGGVPISQEIGIKVLEFNLKDAKSTILIKTVSIDKFSYGRVYSPRYVDMKMVKNSFVKKLVELVTIRSEKENEISTWIEFISRNGDESTIKEIVRAACPAYDNRVEQLKVLKPILKSLLRSPKLSDRDLSLLCLAKLEWTPDDIEDSTAFFIPQTYPFVRWSATSGEDSPEAWAARQGIVSVIKFGNTAINQLIADLEGFQNKGLNQYGLTNGGVAIRAKAILMRLSKKNWTEFKYVWRPGRDAKIISAQPDFLVVEYNFPYRSNKQITPTTRQSIAINPENSKIFLPNVWKQEWNIYATEKLIEILELNKNNAVDEDFLMKRGIKNKNYFIDIIDILGSIADAWAVETLNLYVNHTELGDDAKESIANIKSRLNIPSKDL